MNCNITFDKRAIKRKLLTKVYEPLLQDGFNINKLKVNTLFCDSNCTFKR